MLVLKMRDGDREVVLQFEHSLLAVSKWEQKTKKAFVSTQTKTSAEMIDYFQCMLVAPEDSTNLVLGLSPDQQEKLVMYINDNPTATVFPPERSKGTSSDTTNERIYGQMIMLKIPFHPAETWHLNRLMTLIRVVGEMHEPPKKRNTTEVLTDWIQENRKRREKHNTTG